MTKMARKITRKGIVRKLDSLVSHIVRERDGYCVICGTSENLTCGHLFSRVSYSTRWDLNNCFAQCLGCNLKHEYAPYAFYKWFEEKFGKIALEELDRKHNISRPYKTWELVELHEELTKQSI